VAESLRGSLPLDYSGLKVSMTYRLAHALVEKENVRHELDIKWYEWRMRKSELVGEYRKREGSILKIVRAEEELKDYESEIKKLQETLLRSSIDVEREYFAEREALAREANSNFVEPDRTD
jgi:Na+/phosphate symporter